MRQERHNAPPRHLHDVTCIYKRAKHRHGDYPGRVPASDVCRRGIQMLQQGTGLRLCTHGSVLLLVGAGVPRLLQRANRSNQRVGSGQVLL